MMTVTPIHLRVLDRTGVEEANREDQAELEARGLDLAADAARWQPTLTILNYLLFIAVLGFCAGVFAGVGFAIWRCLR